MWAVIAAACVTIIIYMMLLQRSANDFQYGVTTTPGGFINPAAAMALMADWAIAVSNIKSTMIIITCVILGVFLLLSLYLQMQVSKAAKSSSSSSAAKHMLKWMIPNTVALLFFTAFIILSLWPDLNVSVVSYPVMIVSGIGLNLSTLAATVTQIGVFAFSGANSSS